MKSKLSTLLFPLLILMATIFWSFYSLLPRDIENKEVNLNKFSTNRALIHVKQMSQKPHFVGSPAHSEVRAYVIEELQKLGLTVEIQQQSITNVKWRASTVVYNVLARIPGENHTNALMLLSHYDSSPHASLGASDAASGVATILEGVRAFLEQKPKPKNDIIILISDAEELGLLGAKAFVKYHRWAKDVKLVLNFEARGSGGPSYMLLETNQGNAHFIKAFSKANAPFPISNSLAYSIYKTLPNDTDLTVFREDADIDGYNFAFIDDHFDYHTAQDSFERLDKNTLKHQGTYLMSALDYFSTHDISNLKSNNDFIFFNMAPFGLIFYPFSWIIPLILTALVLFMLLLFYGVKKKKINFKSVLLGFIPLVFSILLVVLLSIFGWKSITYIYPQYADMINKFTYNGSLYIVAFSFFTVFIFISVYQRFEKRISVENALIAPLIIWLLIAIVSYFFLIGATYTIIPFLAGLLSFGLLLISSKRSIPLSIHALLAFPLLILFMPFVYMLPVALGLEMIVASTVLLVLILSLLLPVLSAFTQKWFKTIIVLIGILALLGAHLNANFDEENKKPNSLIYLMNMDDNTASWLSFDAHLDDFTKQFLNQNSIFNEAQITFKSKFNSSLKYQEKTSLLDLPIPDITILSDTINNYQRIIKLMITSNRNANKIEVMALKPMHVYSLAINGDSISTTSEKPLFQVETGKQIMSYFFTENEPVMVELVVPSFEEIDMSVYETKFDLLTNSLFKINNRNASMMPKPYVTSDATVIVKRLNFNVYEE